MIVISLGAGVQSSTMALMAAHGAIDPMPDCAIFADTGDEPQAVYEHLGRLESLLPFPVIRARRKGKTLADHAIAIASTDVTRTASPPWYTKNPDGMLPRQCSTEFKVRVIAAAIRKMLGVEAGRRVPAGTVVEQWIGISTDEMQRMKDSPNQWQVNRWPLIEQRMSRYDCLRWMSAHGYQRPPKSSCVYCPYRSNDQWRDMRDNHPEDWAKAVAIDRAIRPGFHGMDGEAFVHRSLKPLDQVDLSTAADRGQIEFGFLQECDGICGA